MGFGGMAVVATAAENPVIQGGALLILAGLLIWLGRIVGKLVDTYVKHNERMAEVLSALAERPCAMESKAFEDFMRALAKMAVKCAISPEEP